MIDYVIYKYAFPMFTSQGSEQDLALTRKLLKTKGDMSGKGEYCCFAQFERLVPLVPCGRISEVISSFFEITRDLVRLLSCYVTI